MASRPAPLSIVILLAALGCDSTTETSSTGSSTSDVSLGIVSPKAGDCVKVPLDRDANIPITIEAPNATLKPPGTCGATAGCGHVILTVNGARNNAGAAAVIDLISSAANPLNGTIELRADLVDDGGTILVPTNGKNSGKPATASVKFEAKPSCPKGTGGSGGTTSTGGSGGSTSTGGAGGSTSTGGAGGSTSTGGTGGSTSTGGTGGSTGTGGAGGSTTTSTGGTGGTTTTGGTGGV